MSTATKIEWTDSTFNPWIGCTPVGPGCDHCYAAALSKRTGGPAYESGAPRRRTADANWRLPLLWNRRGYATCPACSWRGEWPRKNGLVVVSPECPTCGAEYSLQSTRRRVFCASLSDVFDNEVDPRWRADLFALIAETPDLDWLLLTKRIGNARNMIDDAIDMLNPPGTANGTFWPWANVWLGATVVNQTEAERDVPKLLATPAAVHFLSIEPLLEHIDLCVMHNATDLGEGQPYLCPLIGSVGDGYGDSCNVAGIDWVIAGGESGAGARPAHPRWIRSLRDQCAATDVPFLFKQWGQFVAASEYDGDDRVDLMERGDRKKTTVWLEPDGPCRAGVDVTEHMSPMLSVGKAKAGRLLDGREHTAFPEVRHG